MNSLRSTFSAINSLPSRFVGTLICYTRLNALHISVNYTTAQSEVPVVFNVKLELLISDILTQYSKTVDAQKVLAILLLHLCTVQIVKKTLTIHWQ